MRILPVLLLLLVSPLAQAQVYKCVDANGAVTYTNDRNQGRGCKQLAEDQAVSSVPAPARRSSSASQPTPSNFPRVSPDAQRARDDTRREILEKELTTEESALAEASKSLAETEGRYQGAERRLPVVQNRLQPLREKVELHQRNIDALKKELGNLK
ncbi:DUF4124 domain-containing protein [Aromatoleum toluvorans]|uniref:DUF4124 domain-containing protein n=1 Tax=Aromatoleum toluvorans TaxID=92002 RepID=A0ABX1PVY3_9RHOO|nr:DUF4124 domain-containing protein [Aromatoleum toluvorans]NMG43607.1 DUF4124 domain-containing protein [Aromatoleum toluvorans]